MIDESEDVCDWRLTSCILRKLYAARLDTGKESEHRRGPRRAPSLSLWHVGGTLFFDTSYSAEDQAVPDKAYIVAMDRAMYTDEDK